MEFGIKKAFEELGFEVPIMISGTIEPMGTMLGGQNIEAFHISTKHLNPISIGINCASPNSLAIKLTSFEKMDGSI